MKLKAKIYFPFLLGLACALGIFMGTKLNFNESENFLSSNSKKEKLNRFIDYLDYEYVDEVNTDSIVDLTVNEILGKLDPHSVYLPKEDYAAVSENMKGDFVGIGVSFLQVEDTIVVTHTIEGGPSEHIGIRGGDRILSANGEKLFGKSLSNTEIVKLLKGDEDTKVALQVYRKTEDTILEFNLRRGHVPLKSVDAAYMLTNKLGYIKINRFSETTYEEFKQGLQKLIKQGAEKLTLDLRDNPGGYLSEAIKIADDFLQEDLLILYTKNKSGAMSETFADSGGLFEGKEVFVLINENSASASEIIAGALQDNDIGTIVGRRSYGKGLVQREMDLGDGSAVRLTVARYYTPTGRSIQKPYTNGNKDYFHEYLDRYDNGELMNADSIPVNDSLKYETPKGKVVYGGGGIIPDVFVSKEGDSDRQNLHLMLQGGFMNMFVFNLLEKDRNYYNSLSLQEFNEAEIIDESMARDFLNYLSSQSFDVIVIRNTELLQKYLKAAMAQQLFGSDAFQKIVNQEDPVVEKVRELAQGSNQP